MNETVAVLMGGRGWGIICGVPDVEEISCHFWFFFFWLFFFVVVENRPIKSREQSDGLDCFMYLFSICRIYEEIKFTPIVPQQ